MGVTRQRKKILEIVLGSDEHLSAEQVHALARESFADIGIGTVYRNLNILADSGAIRKIYIPDEPVRYDRTPQPHEHLVCVKCGKITDMPAVDLQLPEELSGLHVKILHHTLVIHCICEDCLSEFRHQL
ncbi:MAG: Fur family transcriptional regulator [Christensenellales bacterium]|jgi:Fe2+ or Zn2+ uptake regulation protein